VVPYVRKRNLLCLDFAGGSAAFIFPIARPLPKKGQQKFLSLYDDAALMPLAKFIHVFARPIEFASRLKTLGDQLVKSYNTRQVANRDDVGDDDEGSKNKLKKKKSGGGGEEGSVSGGGGRTDRVPEEIRLILFDHEWRDSMDELQTSKYELCLGTYNFTQVNADNDMAISLQDLRVRERETEHM
jgi:hypothetical protein